MPEVHRNCQPGDEARRCDCNRQQGFCHCSDTDCGWEPESVACTCPGDLVRWEQYRALIAPAEVEAFERRWPHQFYEPGTWYHLHRCCYEGHDVITCYDEHIRVQGQIRTPTNNGLEVT